MLIEARIIVAMQHGMTSKKKQLYSKVGELSINSRELDRILDEIVARGIVSRYRDESDLKHWHYWRYKLDSA